MSEQMQRYELDAWVGDHPLQEADMVELLRRVNAGEDIETVYRELAGE